MNRTLPSRVARRVRSKAAKALRVSPRKWAAHAFVRGHGIEIGALHLPLTVYHGAKVTYVDRMSVLDLRRCYPELAEKKLVEVDAVDDGESLTTIPDTSQDFVIANHFLEHCEDPIGTMLAFFRVLRPAGVLYAAIPDMRFTFDSHRVATDRPPATRPSRRSVMVSPVCTSRNG